MMLQIDETVKNEIEKALFQIHAMACSLEALDSNGGGIVNPEWNKTSNIILSAVQIIEEKAEFCLGNIDGLDEVKS